MAIEAAKRGAAHIFMLARTRLQLEQASSHVKFVNPSTCSVHIVPCDITNPTDVAAMVKTVIGKLNGGSPDIIINNAGIGAWDFTEESTLESIKNTIACPYLGAFYVTHAFLPGMKRRKSGHIANVTSVAW